MENEWNPISLREFLHDLAQFSHLPDVLTQNPIDVVRFTSISGCVAIGLAVTALVCLPLTRRTGRLSYITASLALMFSLLTLYFTYLSAKDTFFASKHPVPYEVLTDSCNKVLWTPLFCALTFVLVLVYGGVSATLRRIAEARARSSSPPNSVEDSDAR